jgi:uncharacterized protein YabE (DUF348 family)
MKYGAIGAGLAGLVAAPVLWISADKSVDLVVDGKGQTVQTTATDVGQVLSSRGYKVNQHDLLAPGASTAVKDGLRIVLRRGRQLMLNVNGNQVKVWTTAPTVSAALGQLGYPVSDFVSVSRSRRLPLGATNIAIRTPNVVTVVHDGKREQVTTTASSVAALFSELKITRGKYDRLSAPLTSPLHANEVLQLQRVSKKVATGSAKIGFPTARRKDHSMDKGSTKVVRAGKKGVASVTYSLVYIDGKLVGRTVLRRVTITAPRGRILAVGTRRVTTPSNTPNAPAPSPGSNKAIAKTLMANRGWGNDQFSCLVQMWNRESGWSTQAANPSGAYGIPQALPGSKMASAGPDWQNNATTQIKWGLGYIANRYHDPCGAWSFWQAHNYY